MSSKESETDKPTEAAEEAAAAKGDDAAESADDEAEAKSDDEAKPAKKKRTPEEKALAKKLKNRPKWKLFWIVAALSLVADQATKIWARASLPTHPNVLPKTYTCDIPSDIASGQCGGESLSVFDSFWHWRLSMNPGSAFGLFSGQGQTGRVLLSIVGILAVFGMIWMLRKSRPDQKVLHWALALVAGGAVGNLIDRIYYGVVTDFVLWHWGNSPKVPDKAYELLSESEKLSYYGLDALPDRFANEWPVFNVADIVLVIGVALMFIDIQKEGKRDKEKKKRRQEKARAAGLVKDL
jgi:signal peptidase II